MLKRWLSKKRASSVLSMLADARYVIAPKFVSVGEYIFLDCGNENITLYESYKETDGEKIVTEAVENHVHLFDTVPLSCREYAKTVAVAIAENLLQRLKNEFPEKEFAVFLELKYTESVIVRFHQIRKDGTLYIDPEDCKEGYADGTLMLFRR